MIFTFEIDAKLWSIRDVWLLNANFRSSVMFRYRSMNNTNPLSSVVTQKLFPF